jgi:Zn-dependent peptidase ImmA (M78 family)
MASFYKAPEAILEELGVREPADLKIEAIAEYCGATIVYAPLEGTEARILGYGDRAIITVNSATPRSRQRFSGGHELGHWMCDRRKIAFACSESAFTREWSDDNPERRANQYSAELLLPQRMFSRDAKNREMTVATVRHLAEVYQTSLTATAIRLVEFGSFPAMVVCSESERRRWFKRGPDVPEVLWPHQRVSPMTVAHDIFKGKAAASPGPMDVSADAWFGHHDARQYSVREDSIRIAGELVLTLLWWKDESQLLDLEGDDIENDD